MTDYYRPIFRRVYSLRSRMRQRQLRRRGWYDPAARSNHDAIFVGGCGRSGTTLLREMLTRHPRIACGPETSLFGLPFEISNIAPIWEIRPAVLRRLAHECQSIVEFADRFFSEFLLRPTGKARWADKTPNNVRAISKILTWFPRGKFIHMVRDGRDVVCSLRHHPKERISRGRLLKVATDNPIERCAARWLCDTAKGTAFRGHPRYFEVHYEELVRNAEGTLQSLCTFLCEDYSHAMLSATPETEHLPIGRLENNPDASGPITATQIGRWLEDLKPEERQVFHDIAGEFLKALGYVPDEGWLFEPASSGSSRTSMRYVDA